MNKCLNKQRLPYKCVSLEENKVWQHWKIYLLDTYPVSGIAQISCVTGTHNLHFKLWKFLVSITVEIVATNIRVS